MDFSVGSIPQPMQINKTFNKLAVLEENANPSSQFDLLLAVLTSYSLNHGLLK